MKVQELIKKINNKTFNIEKSLEVKKYIPIMDKKRFAMDAISACTDDVDNFITVDRFKMNIYFDMKVLSIYTNLEIVDDFDEMIIQYDALCESEIMNRIITLFEEDYNAMRGVLDDALEELLVQNSIDAHVVKIANKINQAIDIFSNKLNDVDFNSMLPEGINMDDFAEIINALK